MYVHIYIYIYSYIYIYIYRRMRDFVTRLTPRCVQVHLVKSLNRIMNNNNDNDNDKYHYH